MRDVLITVDGVSKKFCRSLKRSLWYGLKDLGNELRGHRHGGNGELRPDEFWAVKDATFQLKRGECLGLIGRNGAGKTTLLRMLNGLIKPDQGRIELRGRVGALIALGAGFNPILTGRENVYVNASVLGLSKREIGEKLDEIIDFAEIGEFIDSPVQTYSSGMQVRLGFSVATALKPDILLLDEVLAVGDAAFRTKCFNRIQDIISDCAVIFVSHSMPQITRICSQLMLLSNGRILTQGPDLGQIIARYHRLSDTTAPSSQHHEGSGQARIKSVLVQDGLRTPRLELSNGEPFSIQLNLWLSDEARTHDPRLLITFADEEDSNVAQVYEPIAHLATTDNILVRLDFQSMPFNAGRYSLTANVLLGPRGEMAHVVRRTATFTVQHAYVGYAPVILRPTQCVVVSSSQCHSDARQIP
jgi:lipopolysaccharide transport system ATP-binding protein